MAKSRMQTQSAEQATTPVSETSGPTAAPAGGRGNQAAADRLQANGEKQTPPVSLGDVGDAGSFMSAASRAMDAALPTRGSFAKLAVSGNIPLMTTGAASITFTPSLTLQVAREQTGEYSAMIASKVQLKASVGKDDLKWLPAFEAYVSGYLQGSLKIQGDSATEIMNLFMLSVRKTMEAACDSTGVPADVKSAIAEAIMGEDTRLATARGMDKNDKVVATVGVGGEVGASALGMSGSAGIDFSHSTIIQNKDGNADSAEVVGLGRASVSVSAPFSHPSLPLKVTPKVTFIYGGDGKLSEWFVAVGADATMKMGEFAPTVLMGTEWVTDLGIAVTNLVRTAAQQGARSETGMVADWTDALNFGPEAIQYTAFGNQLRTWSASPAFAEQSEQKIKFGLATQAGWSKRRGINCAAGLTSQRSFKLGGGDSALTIEATRGDTIAHVRASANG